nr:cytochrome P450 315a1 [Colaphellus bowringi]
MLRRQVQRFFSECQKRSASASSLDFGDLPSPKRLPLIGTTLSLLAAGGPTKLHKYIDKRHEELGPIFKDNVGPVTGVFVADPEGIRSVFANEGKYPIHIKPESWLLYNEKHGCTRGLFFMDGEEWLSFRRIMNNLLLKGDFSWLEESCDVAAERFLDRINTYKNEELPNLEQELYKWSLDVIVSVLLGSRAYGKYHKEVDDLVQKLASTVYLVFERTSELQLIPAKFAEKFQLGRWKRFEGSVKTALDSACELLDHITTHYKDTDGLLAKMVQEDIPRDDLKRIIVDLILGAGDTTAYSMAWILYLLSKNKNVQEDLRQQLTQEKKLPLLRNVVKETLRLYPVAPFLCRFLPETVSVCGYTIPQNTLIVMSIYTSGRSKKYFADPDQFRPDRWLRNNLVSNTVGQLASLPFGMGSRSCVGRKIAEIQFHVTLAKILERFEIEFCNDKEIEDILKMISKPSQPLRLAFHAL